MGPATPRGIPGAILDRRKFVATPGRLRATPAVRFNVPPTMTKSSSPLSRFTGLPSTRRLVAFGLGWLFAAASPAFAQGAAARLTINSGSGSMSSSSTNTGGSFQLANLSSGGLEIVSCKIDLSTAMLPDVVFDPGRTAGDPDGKAFELDSFNGSGTPVHSFESPHDGIGSEDGYYVLRIDCGPSVSFGPGDTMTFSADIDPTSVKGAPPPGPDHAASVSGLELIGATVTVTFDDGTVRTVRMGGVTGDSNTNKMSMGVLSPNNLATPSISVPAKTSPFTVNATPTVRIAGPPGASARLWVIHTVLLTVNGGYDIDPFETNKAVAYGFSTVAIGASGFTDVPVTLSHADAPEGIKLLSAVLVDGSGNRSSCSNILTIDYDPGGSGSTDATVPSTPGNFAASAVTAGSVTLGWSASTDNVAVTGYRIIRNGAPVGTTTQLSYTDSGRTPLTLYNYEVKAFDASGNESGSAALPVTTTADQQAPSVPIALQGIPGNGVAQLSWNAATDEVGVTGYRIYRNGILRTTVTSLGHTEGGLTNGTEYAFGVAAIDAAGNESSAVSVSVTPGTPPPASLRVNVGSASPYVDPQGNTWAADFGFNTGSTFSYSNTIQETDNPQLYQSRRSVSSSQPLLSYAFNVTNGDYRVVLHFVEVSTTFTTGSRVFDLVAEGALKVDNVDIFARVGSFTACVVEFPVTVSDGQLNLDFPKVASNPTLSGIEVFGVVPVEPPPTFGQWLAGHGLAGETTGDSDGGGLGNFAEFELQLDPNDTADDLGFRLRCERQAGGVVISLPALKPIGNYHVHRSSSLEDIENVANRIDTVTRAEVEVMSAAERAVYTVEDDVGGERAFYQLIFEPTAE